MLFNSHVFLFVFLPVTLAVFHLLGRTRRTHLARLWLVAASLFFYGWWNPAYLPLLLGSVALNFAVGAWLATTAASARARGLVLAGGVAADLLTLGWFKYAGFAAESAAWVTGTEWRLPPVVLPLAISFYTFQQIAFLVDMWRRPGAPPRWLDYALFVTFFPQLIAGPIVHHGETIPQFERDATYTVRRRNLEVGVTILVIGLFKKVVLADGIAIQATRVFDQVALGADPDAFAAWSAALAYTFQIYFDFSGYSDMAIGLARLFGVWLPLNFDSPYKATSIIDFWRRWHMTLSRFLRDQLYIPLGGNRRGTPRRYANLMITMLLGGLWHGAGWTFVLWGGLHGLYLLVDHAWRAVRARLGWEQGRAPWLGGWPARGLTFAAVVVAWVVFRAESVGDAWTVLVAMAGHNGLVWPGDAAIRIAHLGGLLALVWLAPSTQILLARYEPALGYRPRDPAAPGWLAWRPSPAFAVAVGVLTLFGVLGINRYSEFLYFQF